MIAIPVGAAKSASNLAVSEEVAWHVSAEVGPVPPYGVGDLLGSDTVSKLIKKSP
jgi:pyridoxal/pyridoxine/pyridoxamine kinase